MESCFSLEELAEYWKCSKRHIVRLVEQGRLQAINLGTDRRKQLRFRRSDVDGFGRSDELRYEW